MERRVAIYCRTSTTDKQDPEMQLRELREFARLRGWQVVSEYVDQGYSGRTTERPSLKRLMGDARKRECDIVLVWKLDRFARSLREIVNSLHELNDLGIEFVSLKDALDLTTSQGRLMLGIVASFAQFERDLIVARVKSGLENAKAKGKRLGRPQRRNDAKIRELRARGLSLRAISKQLGIAKASVQRGLEGWAENPLPAKAVNS